MNEKNGYFSVIWYNFPRFGILCEENSGNPGSPVGRKVSGLYTYIHGNGAIST
jgi:hypothetical protein